MHRDSIYREVSENGTSTQKISKQTDRQTDESKEK